MLHILRSSAGPVEVEHCCGSVALWYDPQYAYMYVGCSLMSNVGF